MNRRLAVNVLIVALILGACTPGLSPVSNQASQATSVAQARTEAAQTLALLPTLTMPPTNTALPTQPPTQTSTATVAPPTATSTVAASATATLTTGTPASATATIPASATATATIPTTTGTLATATSTVTGTPPTATKTATGTPPTPTATDLMVTRVYGTQPPYVEYGRIELVNQSKTQVYISFQCTTHDGYQVIEEYPVEGTLKVSVAAGRCSYVAWIGGKQFTGEFGLKPFEELTFTFKKTGITIE